MVKRFMIRLTSFLYLLDMTFTVFVRGNIYRKEQESLFLCSLVLICSPLLSCSVFVIFSAHTELALNWYVKHVPVYCKFWMWLLQYLFSVNKMMSLFDLVFSYMVSLAEEHLYSLPLSWIEQIESHFLSRLHLYFLSSDYFKLAIWAILYIYQHCTRIGTFL